MKKSPSLVAMLVSLLAVGAGVQACAGGMTSESDAGSSGSGGQVTTGSGGRAVGSGGQVTTGSGGRVTTGSGGAGSTVSCSTSPDHPGAVNGYVTAAPWMGYAYTASYGTMVTVSPMCDAAGALPCYKNAAAKLCMMGTVQADTGSGAIFGWGLSQSMAGGAKAPVTVTGTGVMVNAPGMTTAMRIQITNGTTEWCAQVPTANTAMIPWSMFKTLCYGTTGTPFAMTTAITDVQILVPGGSAVQNYCFCVQGISTY
jgi:hypothetical protein